MRVLGRVGGQASVAVPQIPVWPEEEKHRSDKQTLGVYITGHPLNKYAAELRLSGGATTETLHRDVDETGEDRDPKEAESEKYGDREDNVALFGAAEPEAEAEPEAAHEVEPEPVFASHAAAFHEAPITPELNALEIVPLEGIREKKV